LEFRRQVDALAIAAHRFQDVPTDPTAVEDVRKHMELVTSKLRASVDLDYNGHAGARRVVADLRHDCNSESFAIEGYLELWLSYPEERERSGRIPAAIAAAAEKLDALLHEAELRAAADHD